MEMLNMFAAGGLMILALWRLSVGRYGWAAADVLLMSLNLWVALA